MSNQCTGLQRLRELAFIHKRNRHPAVPVDCLVKTVYTERTANGLTKCVIDFLHLNGWQAERISNTGRLVDRRQCVTDVMGHSRIIGGVEWIKGNGTVGTADISATIAGKSVKIEVKIGNDRQSEAQRIYQGNIERSGGVYFIAKTFQGFYEWYGKNFGQ